MPQIRKEQQQKSCAHRKCCDSKCDVSDNDFTTQFRFSSISTHHVILLFINQSLVHTKNNMDSDQESLLAGGGGATALRYYLGNNGSSRWKKNLFLILISVSIAICLTVYFYLNMQAINSNQEPGTSSYKPLSRRKPMLDHESIFSDSGPSMIKLSDLLAHCIVALRVAGKEVVDLSLANNKRLHDVGSKGKTKEGADDIVTGADIKSHQIIINTIKDSYRRLNIVSEEDSTHIFDQKSAFEDILPIERTRFAQLLRGELREIENQHVDQGSLIAQHETLVWIDPLDATKEYSENLTDYVTLMACIVYKSTPIAGVIFKPFTNQTYWSLLDMPSKEYHHSRDINAALSEAKSRQNSSTIRIIVSRSHAGQVESVVKSAYGERVKITPAGGSGYKTVELLKGRADAYVHVTQIKKWDICAPTAILNSLPEGKLTDLYGDKVEFGNSKDKVVTKGLAASLNKRIHEELISLRLNTNSN